MGSERLTSEHRTDKAEMLHSGRGFGPLSKYLTKFMDSLIYLNKDQLELRPWASVALRWLDNLFGRFMWWRWLSLKADFAIYCPRCGGCGYVDCCGMKCDQGLFCAHYYEDHECIRVRGVQRCIPQDF